jgi:autotransporter-associated beta strand protein
VTGGVANLAGPNGSFLNVPGIFALTSGVFLLNNDGGVDVTTSNNPNRFADTTPVSLAHGVIELRAMQAAAGDSTETLGPVSTSGHSVLKISRLGGSANAILSAQSLTRLERGVTRLQPAATGTLGGLDKFFILNNPPVPVNGMVTPWIVNDTERTFVTYGVNGFANAAFTSFDPNTATATDIVDVATGVTLLPNRTVYAIRVGNGTLNPPSTLTVASGGMIFTATTTQTVTFAFPAGVEGLLYNASGTTLTLNGAFTAPNGLTKFGTGTVLMRSTNTSGLASPITATGGVLSFGIDNTAANDQGYFPATGFLQSNGGGTANFFPSLTIGGLGGAGIVMWGNTAAPVKREITLANQDENIFLGTLQRNSIAGTAGGGTTAGEALFTKAGAGHLRLDGAFLNGIREFKVHAGRVTFSGNARWTPQNERGRLVVNQGAEVTIDNSVVNLPDRLALDYNSNSEAGGAFRLAGGTFRFVGNAAANSSETVNRLPATVTVANFRPTFGPGTDLIEINPGAGRSATLTFITNSGATDLSFVREAGASVFIEGRNLGDMQGATDTANLLFTSAPPLTGVNNGTGVRGTPQVGVMKGVVVRSAPSVGEGGTRGVATYDPGADGIFGNGDDLGVRRLLASELASMIADGDTITLANVLLSSTQALTGASAVNSLHLRGGTVLGATALAVSSGMILSEGNTANSIGVSALDFGTSEGLLTSTGALPLVINSQITGTAGLTLGGSGGVRLNHTGNSFSGPITVNSATLFVQDNGALGAAANSIVLNNGARLLGDGSVTLDNGAGVRRAITLGGPGAQLTALSGSLTVSGVISGGVSTLSGLIPSETTALDLAGVGTITLTGANTYTGRTDVRSGTRIVGDGTSGSLAGPVRVMLGGRLGGLGTIGGEVAVESTGTLDPGTAIASGTLNIGGLRMGNGATLALRFDSNSAFDRLNVTGGVSLIGDTELTLSLGFDPQDNVDSFLIVQNDGTDPVAGLFYVGGVPIGEGESFTMGGQLFRIRYTLGTGNDVVLLAVPEPCATAMLGASIGLLAGLRRRRSI